MSKAMGGAPPPLELLGEQEGVPEVEQDAHRNRTDDDVLGHPRRPLQPVRGAHVEKAQAQEHERDAVEDDVRHAVQLPLFSLVRNLAMFTAKAV
jgi:hypothetical protein